jgi:hypothetical protein
VLLIDGPAVLGWQMWRGLEAHFERSTNSHTSCSPLSTK